MEELTTHFYNLVFTNADLAAVTEMLADVPPQAIPQLLAFSPKERRFGGKTVLHEAVLNTNLQVLRHLLTLPGADVNTITPAGDSPLSIAVELPSPEITEELLNHPDIDVNLRLRGGETTFYLACKTGSLDIVEKLLQIPNLDVNAGTADGVSPLLIACVYTHTLIVKRLLADGRVNVNAQDSDGFTPLLYACQLGSPDIFEMLLRIPGININCRMKEGATPFYAACQFGSVEIAKKFLELPGADLHTALIVGETPFFVACECGRVDLVNLLLRDPRIDTSTPRNDGLSPLAAALTNGHIQVVQDFFASGRYYSPFQRPVLTAETLSHQQWGTRGEVVIHQLLASKNPPHPLADLALLHATRPQEGRELMLQFRENVEDDFAISPNALPFGATPTFCDMSGHIVPTQPSCKAACQILSVFQKTKTKKNRILFSR